MAKRKVLFIDRDGTLIEEPEDEQVDSLDKIRLLPGVIPALLDLKAAGFEFVLDMLEEAMDGLLPEIERLARLRRRG